ncbi:MAG TPA: DNA mismatch repair protein MutS [Chitinophagaceae bacterium]|nr:DNA mismatch repair protein MutS [Chitinophagaceae bacterium]
MFQFVNRAQTYIGQSTLAHTLTATLPVEDIQQRQDAVKECKAHFNWRQQIQATATIAKDKAADFHQLQQWTATQITPIPTWIRLYGYIGPLLFLVTFIAWVFLPGEHNWKLCSAAFTLNLIVFSSVLKLIKQQIPEADKIHQPIQHYGQLLQLIEQASFTSTFMTSLQQQLSQQGSTASQQLKRLSNLFERMDSLHNLIGTALFNGTGLYHLHVLQALMSWKQQHAASLSQWLHVIGEVEAINSLANLAFNQPDFCFPTLTTQQEFEVKDLGHPLIHPQQRICNSISLNQHPFIILTGSNMSGKSTFLRTMGINMILASAGGPVCAKSAKIHPLPMMVSMRLSDSLGDNESFFFAEVKKLKSIIDALKQGPCFVLLDEILRGTNSDDKRNGTILFLEQLIRHHAIGIIATHDLEVCRTTDQWPNYLRNCCFEVEIKHNELHFDYLLRDGICQNKSASFLMKKMEII